MQISSNMKLIGNCVGMTLAVGVTWSTSAYLTYSCFTNIVNILRSYKYIEINEHNRTTFQTAARAIGLGVPTIITFGVLPRILPFIKVSYRVVPHWNWEWIEARLPR